METRTIDTARIRSHCWIDGPDEGEPLLLVHGNITTGRFWQGVVEKLPRDRFRVVAPDLRSFGRTQRLPVDATRGLRDWSDDLRALVEALGWSGRRRVHAAGWSLGGGVLQQYELDHAEDLASLTLVAPLSPFGFGATRDVQGTLTWPDGAGSGGGTAAPDFVKRLAAGDMSEEEPQSSPRVVMRSFFWSPRYQAADEDELIREVLLTAVGDQFYPGDATSSAHWPGVAPGRTGVNNAMAPIYCNTSAFGDIAHPVPLLWIRGDEDQVVSNESMFDFGQLGKLGVVPGWPAMDVYPPQPQVSQARAVFERRRDRAPAREVVLEQCGHGPPVERAAEVARLLVEHIDAARG